MEKKTMRLVMTTVITVGLILAVIGFFLTFATMKGANSGIMLFKMRGAWGVISIILAILGLIMSLALMIFAVMKWMNKYSMGSNINMIVSVITVIVGILLMISVIIYCSVNSTTVMNIKLSMMPAVGAYLMTIGVIISGVAGYLNKMNA